MQLVINTYGAYLHREGTLFLVKIDGKTSTVAARKVQSILIATGASFSSDAIQLAVESNIDVLFVDKFGDPYGRVWHGRPGSTTAIRRRQLEIAATDEGLALAKTWGLRKLDNQIDLLTRLRERRTRLSTTLTQSIDSLKALRPGIAAVAGPLSDVRSTLLGLEGNAGRLYWETLSHVIPEPFTFSGRSRNPAKDEFNCLLNYAYGVLYGTVERACLLAGLDPYVGFVHTDHYAKPSLVFDLIENYRIWADETVIDLFAGRKIKKDQFDPLRNGFTLNKEGKAVLIEAFTRFLDEPIRYRNRNVSRRDSVQLDFHRFANELIERPQEDGPVRIETEKGLPVLEDTHESD